MHRDLGCDCPIDLLDSDRWGASVHTRDPERHEVGRGCRSKTYESYALPSVAERRLVGIDARRDPSACQTPRDR